MGALRLELSEVFLVDFNGEEVIRMTKVERLYEEEKQEAVKKAVKEAVDENTGRIAINMLRGGDSEEKVSSCTGLSPEVVKQLALEAV